MRDWTWKHFALAALALASFIAAGVIDDAPTEIAGLGLFLLGVLQNGPAKRVRP